MSKNIVKEYLRRSNGESERYWREREEEQRRKNIRDEQQYAREVAKIYARMEDNIQKEIEAFLGKYADQHGITMAEARRRVDQLDIDAYARKAAQYVKERNFSDQANAEMRIYNLTMRVNRLEMLKARIGMETVAGADEADKLTGGALESAAYEEFERLAGILGHTVQNNEQYVHAIVNASFHNANYSERIWMNRAALQAELEQLIARGLIQGEASKVLAAELRRKIGGARYDAERLMRTEMKRVRTEVAKQSYERNGNKQYIYMALGAKPCPICEDIDGEVYEVKDMTPGANAPPMHPNCHCSTAPYWDDTEYQAWLDSFGEPDTDGVPYGEFEAEQNPVANGADSGILKTGGIEAIPITEKAIESIPLIKPSGWTEERAVKLQEAHRELLRAAAEHPVGIEVGAIYSIDLEKLQQVEGNVGKVKIPKLPQPHIILHNHPDGNTFSEGDVESFIMRTNLQAMTAVGNDGTVYWLGKTGSYDGFEFRRRYTAIEKELQEYADKDDLTGYISVLRKLYEEAKSCGVEFIERRT